jgi:hypothetical protein
MRVQIEELHELDAPELWEWARRNTRESQRIQASHVRSGLTFPQQPPPPDIEATRIAADVGMSLPNTLRAFRLGTAAAAERWVRAVEALEVSEEEQRDCMSALTRFLIAYDDVTAVYVSEEFERARFQSTGNPDKQRLRQIRSLISGGPASADSLDYDLDLTHLGVIGWGSEPVETLTRLANVLDRELLWAPAEDGLVMAWVSGRRRLSPDEWVVIAAFTPKPNTMLAIGSDAQGIDGFRRTHREAGEATVVALRAPRQVTIYREVALEAFALRDESAAREFVAHTLGPLSANGRSQDLRATLRAYFAAGQNASSAAAALGVHEQTVARRLQTVERALGTPVNPRRAELELALRLEDLLQAK